MYSKILVQVPKHSVESLKYGILSLLRQKTIFILRKEKTSTSYNVFQSQASHLILQEILLAKTDDASLFTKTLQVDQQPFHINF